MCKDLFNDGYFRIFIDNKKGYYTDFLRGYKEISLNCAYYVSKKIDVNNIKSYRILDFLMEV